MVSRRGQESLDHAIRPLGVERPPLPQITRPPRAPLHRLDPTFRPQFQAITGFTNDRQGGIRTRQAKSIPQHVRPHIENEARRDYEAGKPFTTQHFLNVPWASFLRNFPPQSSRERTSAHVARENLDEICRQTNTYIGTPSDNDNDVKIWGTDEDSQEALAQIQTFEFSIRRRGIRPSRDKWTKEKAHDGRVEDRAFRDLQTQAKYDATYQLNKHAQFVFEAYLLWPDKVDMKRFREKYEETVLRQIQEKTFCRIDFVNEGERHVKISTQEERHVYATYQRVVNLVKESIAENGLFSHNNRIRLPRASMYRDKVALDRDPNIGLSLPTLFGEPLDTSQQMQWEQLCRSGDHSNQHMLKAELESILRAIQGPGQQLRMRVTFTELGLFQFERPEDDAEHYSIDGFCTMLAKPLTEIKPAGLRSDTTDLSKLVDLLSDMDLFENLEYRYTLHFDFRGSNEPFLRYEREMRIGYQGELEDEANRWMQFSRENDYDLLEFNLLDFEHLRANYQVNIGKTPLYEPKDQKHLQDFSNHVRYKNDPLGLKAQPKRRAVFPVGQPSLIGHKEITIARFSLKDSDARFELSRRDEFNAKDSGKEPSRTMWFAQYYYPEWDSLLGEFGNLKPGDKVSWPRKLDTFFIPERAIDDTRPLPKGVKGFLNEIEAVQECLQSAIEQLPAKRGLRAASANGVTHEMNGMTIE